MKDECFKKAGSILCERMERMAENWVFIGKVIRCLAIAVLVDWKEK